MDLYPLNTVHFLGMEEIHFYRSQFEKEPDLEKIKQFRDNSEGLEIVFDKCEISWCFIYFTNVIRQLFVLQTKVHILLKVRVKQRKENCDDFTFINTVVENSQIGGWNLQMSGDTSIGFLKFYNTDIVDGYVTSEGGLGYLHFDNCTFTHTTSFCPINPLK